MLSGSKKYKIFFPIEMTIDWLGGINYYKNLFHALSLLPDKPIEVYIPEGNPEILYKYAKSIQQTRKKDFKYRLNKLTNILSGKKFDKEKYFSEQVQNFAIISHTQNFDKNCPHVAWISDLQHKYFPELFKGHTLKEREYIYDNSIEQSSYVLLSSYSAQKDFEKFYPNHVGKTKVLNFVSYINPEIYEQTDVIKNEIKKKFNLPNKYFYLPNQFWQHKNHITVLKAVNELKQKGINIHIVCTGNTGDYRNKNYFNDVILKYINENSLENNIHILGIVDLKEVYCLMRTCISVINPSLFEGWSSTVEEVKSLGKNIILSDLDVHKEQNPPCATYFERENYKQLSEILLDKWNNPPTQTDIELEKQARSQMEIRMRKFGENYLSIIQEIDKHLQPKLTIVTVVRNLIKANRVKFFEKCIKSVHNQTYKNTEHIIIDGASDDGTLKILKKYEKRGWIKLFSEPDTGIYDAMNKGLAKATGDYISFLNSDDFYHDKYGLEHVAQTLGNSNVDFTYSTSNYIKENDDLFGVTSAVPESFFIRMPFCHQTLFARTDLLRNLGGFDTNFKSAADYDLIIRMFLNKATHKDTNYNFVSFRVCGLSWENPEMSINECIKTFEKNYAQLATENNLNINFHDMFYNCVVNEMLHNLLLDKVSQQTKIKMLEHWANYSIINDTRYVTCYCEINKKCYSVCKKIFNIPVCKYEQDEHNKKWTFFGIRVLKTRLKNKEVNMNEITKQYLLFGFIPLYKSKKWKNGYKKYIFGIPYATFQGNKKETVKRTFFQIFKKKKSYMYSKYYFLGIQVWCKKKSKIDILIDKVSFLQKQTQNIQSQTAALQVQTSSLQTQTQNIQTQNTALQAQTSSLQAQTQTLQNENINLKNKLINKNNEILSIISPNYNDYFCNEQKSSNTEIAESRYITPIQTTKCKICGNESKLLFESKIFHNKYDAKYFYCPHCGFLQVSDLKWLEESYKTPVTQEDTGVLWRNLKLQKYISILLFNLLNPNGKYLDYGGGYGFLTRLLRDVGFEYYHWDKYSENVTARGFEGDLNIKYDAVTSIETFEHFDNPIYEIEQMLKLTDTIIFTEEILPTPIPEPSEWWYYCLNHGQHISFYSVKTFEYIAHKYNLYYSNIYNLHILSKENFEIKINDLKTKNINILFENIKKIMKPLILDDMNHIIEITNKI